MSAARLTTLDASFLEVESASAHMHVGWMALFGRPDGGPAPDFFDFRRHVAGRMSRAPRYRQKLATVPLGVNGPVWVDDPAFDIDRHVHRSDARNCCELADQVMSEQLERDRPLWEIWVADRLSDGRVGVIGKAHHAMVDGLAAVELASLLLDATPEAPRSEDDGWHPASHPGPVELLVEGLIDRAGQARDLARLPLRLARHPERATRWAAAGLRSALAVADSLRLATSESPLNGPISPRRHLARTRRPLDDMKQVKGRFDATVNDVMLAAAAGGLRRFMLARGEQPVALKAMVPVSVRANGDAGDLGNQISFIFVDLPCDEPDPSQRMVAVRQSVGRRKRNGLAEGADRFLTAFGYAPQTIQRVLAHAVASPRAFNLVVSNIPGPRQELYMLGCPLEEVYPVVPLADRHAVSIGMTTVQDDAFFGIYADSESLPDADTLAACLDESLDELLALDR